MEVFIDGIKYVPAKTVQPSDSRLIKIALMEDFWGDCSNDTDEELNEKWADVYIFVSDDSRGYRPEDLVSIDMVLNKISKLQAQSDVPSSPAT